MADLGPAIVTLIGTLGGGVLGVLGSWLVTRSGNRHAADLAADTRAHESRLELSRAVRAARERSYPGIVTAVQQANALSVRLR